MTEINDRNKDLFIGLHFNTFALKMVHYQDIFTGGLCPMLSCITVWQPWMFVMFTNKKYKLPVGIFMFLWDFP